MRLHQASGSSSNCSRQNRVFKSPADHDEPAHRYVLDVYAPTLTGPTGRATLRAREWDPEGGMSAEFAPVSSQNDIARCQRAANS